MQCVAPGCGAQVAVQPFLIAFRTFEVFLRPADIGVALGGLLAQSGDLFQRRPRRCGQSLRGRHPLAGFGAEPRPCFHQIMLINF